MKNEFNLIFKFSLIFFSILLLSCSNKENLQIKLIFEHKAPIKIKLINQTKKEINFISTIFSNPLDVFNLSAGNAKNNIDIYAFLLGVVDEKGTRHLECSIKQFAPPGIPLEYKILAPKEFIEFSIPPPKNFSECIKSSEKLFWQVAYIKTKKNMQVNLNNKNDYKVIFISNKIPIEIELE